MALLYSPLAFGRDDPGWVSGVTEMEFGKLKDLALRDVWDHEAKKFTPWLFDNIERLSDAIGLPMEPEGTEVAVKQFSADIVARNPDNGSRILIENQLEGSNHTHLGQILTYLAGVQAETVIWVARDFDESHRSAIRWLNDHTVQPFAFFAVRVRVVQIAESPLVPLFEVIERPSTWDRSVRTTVETGTSERTQFRLDFWNYYANRHPTDGVSSGHKLSHFWVWIEPAELHLSAYVAQRGVGVSVRGEHGEAQDIVRDRIQRWEQDLRDALSVEIGAGTSWGSYAQSRYRTDATDRGNWPEMADWLHNKIADYRRVLESSAASSPQSDSSDR